MFDPELIHSNIPCKNVVAAVSFFVGIFLVQELVHWTILKAKSINRNSLKLLQDHSYRKCSCSLCMHSTVILGSRAELNV